MIVVSRIQGGDGAAQCNLAASDCGGVFHKRDIEGNNCPLVRFVGGNAADGIDRAGAEIVVNADQSGAAGFECGNGCRYLAQQVGFLAVGAGVVVTVDEQFGVND